MKIKAGKILKYTLMPRIVPRFKDLFYSGFAYIAFFMAQIYRAVRLLPQEHPYLNPVNMGQFGVRHVIVEAGSRLVFKKENTDQIAIFFMLLAGIVLLIAQLFILFFAGFVDLAHAAAIYPSSSPLNFFTYFQTPNALHDVAFVLLDRVFGIGGVGGAANTSFFADASGGYSCVATGVPCFTGGGMPASSRVFPPSNVINTTVGINTAPNAVSLTPGGAAVLNFPWPYHAALHSLLQIYSVGLLVIGVFIFLYFFFAVAAETAQTGTAFGRRFNHLWAPIRMVFAIGLLVPITYGLNPAQWVLMYAAKWGSSFATNGWIIYSNSITSAGETMLGPTNTLVATPNNPPVNTLMSFGSVLATCVESYDRLFHQRVNRDAVNIDAWLVNPNDISLIPRRLVNTTFQQAMDYFKGSPIHVRFGELRSADDGSQMWDGRVAPWCGEITLDLTYVPTNYYQPSNLTTEPGSWHMLSTYYNLILAMWFDTIANGNCFPPASTNACNPPPVAPPSASSCGIGGYFSPPPAINFSDIGQAMADRHISICNDKTAPLPTAAQLDSLRTSYEAYIDTNIALAVAAQQASTEWQESLNALGWAGAAVWYNKVAQLNGGLVSAVHSMPTVSKFPYVMEQVTQKKAASDASFSGQRSKQVYRGAESPLPLDQGEDEELAKAMFEAMTIWGDSTSAQQPTTNALLDVINMIFGLEGLLNITSNEAMNIHPLAQLTAIGRSIVDSSVSNLGYSAMAGVGGGLANIMGAQAFGSALGVTSSFIFQVAVLGLAIGFVLFYIIPFLPFIYFFFAVGGWIKGVFEAMVGVPLWALAHIRIDGDGLPGAAAMGGYYLIFEIFLRPILTIFGFIASITIFTAQVQILNSIWDTVVTNVSGNDVAQALTVSAGNTGSINFVRGGADKLFYTVIYAIICYMMAMGSFKLIDQIPNHMLRWMGANVQTFGEQAGDPAQNLVRNSFIGTRMLAGPMSQMTQGAKGAAQHGAGAMGELFGRTGGK